MSNLGDYTAVWTVENYECSISGNISVDTLSAVDIKTVDPEQLVDIRDISIHTELPREERVLDFIRQIRNPYYFRHGKIVVKIGFSEAAKETTMEEQFESYLRTL